MNFIQRFRSLPISSRRLLSIGMVLALVVALPLFIWAIVTQKFLFNQRAASGEPNIVALNIEEPFTGNGMLDPSKWNWSGVIGSNVVLENDRLKISVPAGQDSSAGNDAVVQALLDYQIPTITGDFDVSVDLLGVNTTNGWEELKFAPGGSISIRRNKVGNAETLEVWESQNNTPSDSIRIVNRSLPSNSPLRVKLVRTGNKILAYYWEGTNSTFVNILDTLYPPVTGDGALPRLVVENNGPDYPVTTGFFDNYSATASMVVPANPTPISTVPPTPTPSPTGYPSTSPYPTTIATYQPTGFPTATPQSQVDLTIENISLERVSPPSLPCESYRYSVRVRNIGTQAAPATRLHNTLNPSQPQAVNSCSTTQPYLSSDAPIPSHEGDMLAPGASETYTDYFNPTQNGTVIISSQIDAQNQVAETNEFNNYLSNTFTVSAVYPPPTVRPFTVKFKFEGVNDESASLSKVAVRFLSRTLDNALGYTTSPIPADYIGNGLYALHFGIWSTDLPTANDYSLVLKGEKHLSVKFCTPSGQTAHCSGSQAGSISLPFNPIDMVNLDFTGVRLIPGDLSPQDGMANAGDFARINSLLSKPHSALTVQDLLTGDLNYDGYVNILDAFLMRLTLQTRYDEN